MDEQVKRKQRDREQADTAPHRIVNWKALQETVNPVLDKCSVCKKRGLKLVEKSRISLASTFELECTTCKAKVEKLEQHIFYLQRQLANGKNRKLYVNLANQKAKLEKLKDLSSAKRVHPIPNKKLNRGNGNQSYTLEYELNVRAMMSAFYIGTGGFDIGELIGMFGLPGGKGWERQFGRHSPFLNGLVIDLAEKMMKESLILETNATIEEELREQKFSDDEIKKAMKAW